MVAGTLTSYECKRNSVPARYRYAFRFIVIQITAVKVTYQKPFYFARKFDCFSPMLPSSKQVGISFNFMFLMICEL
ncbi:hypothetical protein YC2023_005249 [Brassica napus]